VNCVQLEHFLAVARCKRFSRAAEECYISQSSLSKHIKALEEELGVELFVRGYSEVSLTPAGEMFLPFAKKTFLDYEEILQGLAQYSPTAPLRIRIGALPLMDVYDLHSDIADFQVDDPGIQIDFHELNQGEILRHLEMNQLDVAFLRTDRLSAEEFEWIPLIRDEIMIVCSIRHPLARAHRVAVADLKDERFVLIDKQSSIYALFIEECRRGGFVPNVTFTHARHEPLVSAVAKNIGITALPQGLTRGRNESLLACVPLTTPLFSEVGLVIPRGKALTPWTRRLVDHFRRTFPEPKTPSQLGL